MSTGPEQPSAAEPAAAPRPIADEELQLLVRYTGQNDLGALRQHVVALWQRACSGSAPVYLCVRALMFLEPRIRSHPAYQRALELIVAARQAAAAAPAAAPAAVPLSGAPGGSSVAAAPAAAAPAAAAATPLWIDVGAAVGTDVRQLRVDGLQFEELVALDVPASRHYWCDEACAARVESRPSNLLLLPFNLPLLPSAADSPSLLPPTLPCGDVGLELYMDASRPPCAALFGDITDDAVLPPVAAAGAAPAVLAAGAAAEEGASASVQSEQEQQQHQQRLDSIGQLAGAAHVVSCTAVLHCLGQEQVAALLSKMALLLRPGGLLLGSTLGAPIPRPWEASYQAGHSRWLHSGGSLAAALEAAGFGQVQVAPTTWQDLQQHCGAIQPLVQQHVGSGLGGLGADERCMLAFTAVRRVA